MRIDGQTRGRTVMVKQIVAFRSFANAPKNGLRVKIRVSQVTNIRYLKGKNSLELWFDLYRSRL
jgi:hypothetical protein